MIKTGIMKDFIINFGRGLIDFSTWAIFLLIFIGGIFMLFLNPLIGIAILLIGTIIFVAFYYLLYLFIDIRVLLKETVEKNKSNIQ